MRGLRGQPVGITATQLVTGARQEAYGDPLENYERLAKHLEALFDCEVTRRQAIHVMILVKLCRDGGMGLRDNEVDVCGYATILQMDREDVEKRAMIHREASDEAELTPDEQAYRAAHMKIGDGHDQEW